MEPISRTSLVILISYQENWLLPFHGIDTYELEQAAPSMAVGIRTIPSSDVPSTHSIASWLYAAPKLYNPRKGTAQARLLSPPEYSLHVE